MKNKWFLGLCVLLVMGLAGCLSSPGYGINSVPAGVAIPQALLGSWKDSSDNSVWTFSGSSSKFTYGPSGYVTTRTIIGVEDITNTDDYRPDNYQTGYKLDCMVVGGAKAGETITFFAFLNRTGTIVSIFNEPPQVANAVPFYAKQP